MSSGCTVLCQTVAIQTTHQRRLLSREARLVVNECRISTNDALLLWLIHQHFGFVCEIKIINKKDNVTAMNVFLFFESLFPLAS